MMWEQEGQIGRSRTAGKGPVGEAPKKREGKIGPWGKPVGGGGSQEMCGGEVPCPVFCGCQRMGGQKEADPTPPSAHCPTLEAPQLTSHTWDSVFPNRGF